MGGDQSRTRQKKGDNNGISKVKEEILIENGALRWEKKPCRREEKEMYVKMKQKKRERTARVTRH